VRKRGFCDKNRTRIIRCDVYTAELDKILVNVHKSSTSRWDIIENE